MPIQFGDKIKVDLAEIKEHLKFRALLNTAELDNIEWYQDGKILEIAPEVLQEWIFCGLSNIDFAKQLLDPTTHIVLKLSRTQDGNSA